jgi:uncharacterized membrane protein
MAIVIGYLGALAAFLVADMAWLGAMVGRLYRPVLGDIAAPSVNLSAAAAFYLVFPIGLAIFAIAPGLRGGSLTLAAVNGALFGLFTYATYDLTNQATLRKWTTQLTLIDTRVGSHARRLDGERRLCRRVPLCGRGVIVRRGGGRRPAFAPDRHLFAAREQHVLRSRSA